ncbi:MAG: hypothetical protein IPM07_25715 [Anaerolineales bacterium]|nr:hypothetical protein [Anaerolineales bacterium]
MTTPGLLRTIWPIRLRGAASRALADGLPTPEVGYDLVGRGGRVVATAELAWPDRRIALFLPGQESDLLQAGAQGWRTLLAEEPLQATRSLLVLWHSSQETPR